MSNPAKRRGTAVEVKVRNYLRVALGQPGIDRQPLRGARDEGDLRGLVVRGCECVVEVKAKRDMRPSLLAEYRRQTLVERENAGAGVGVLVTWRYNHPAADAVAHVTLRDLTRLVPVEDLEPSALAWADRHWVRMTLEELCLLITDYD